MTAPLETVELPGGVLLPYLDHGALAGLPVVFLHGITDSLRSFEPLLPHLPPSLRALIPSQRGHGEASRPLWGYHPEDFASDLACLLDALELDAAVVVGHSMGSTVAQRFAIEFPERTLGLVLVGSFLDFRNNPAILELWQDVQSLGDPVAEQFALEFQKATLARPVPPAFLDMVVRESVKVPARVWRTALRGLIETNLSGELARIQAPSLIVWGDRDAFCLRAEQEQLASSIPGARLVEVPGAGHALHWEDPAGFTADLLAFVEHVAVGTRHGLDSRLAPTLQ